MTASMSSYREDHYHYHYPPETNIVDLFVNDNGTLYGLNGTALGHPDGAYKDLHAIWKPGFDVKPLQDAARKLC